MRHLVAIGRLVRLLQDPDGCLVTRRVAVLPWDRLLKAEKRLPKRESRADPM